MIVILSIMLLAPLRLSAAVFHVHTLDGLENALHAAQDNGEDDTINVGEGHYTVSGTLTYQSTEDHGITIEQAGGPVIIDGNGGLRILEIWAFGNADVTIKGVAFVDGFVSDDTAACLSVRTQFGNITLEDVQVKDGRAGSLFGSANAGGAYVRIENTGTMLIKDCTFSNNYAKGIGGGLYVVGGMGTTVNLVNNVLYANQANTQGGGLYLNLIDGDATLTNNTFTNNTTGYGSGGGGIFLSLYLDTATAGLYNNIIWGNTAENGIGEDLYLEDDGNSNDIGAAVQIQNNDYGDMDAHSGSHVTTPDNIDQSPLLTGGARLLRNSPCIDRGTAAAPNLPLEDFEGDPRSMDGNDDTTVIPDMGADEYRYVPHKPFSASGFLMLL
ncbi:MAG: hypothetical protein SWE60_21215 [Thermodesulfobacteriota bacterium]|nr:hypothetical protein [Thermodesulfobacteriota bacterium]